MDACNAGHHSQYRGNSTTEPLSNQRAAVPTRTILLGIWEHLNHRRRLQLGLLFLVMLASGGVELVSMGTVLSFLAVLSDPQMLWQQTWVQALASRVSFSSASQLLLPTTLVFAATAVVVALTRLFNLWLNGRLAAAVGTDLSCEAYRRTLHQPYGVHVQRNSAAVINANTFKIATTVAALNSVLQLATSAVVAVGVLSGLLLIDAPVALAAAALFGSAYAALAITTRRKLRGNGQKISEASTLRLKTLQEGLGAIRDVLLDGSQPTFQQIHRQADHRQRRLEAQNIFLGAFPRYALEALGMVAIALLGGLLVVQRGSSTAVIPLLGSLALGVQRLLPALQQIYSGWASLKASNAAIQVVLAMLDQPLPAQVSAAAPLPLRKVVRLEKVHFRYVLDQQDVISGLDLEIRRGERIGIIGSTGGGKSTTVDLLMGLLHPTKGRLLVDGTDVHDPGYPELLLAWRKSIAHVPQSIYLADSSFAENIAFGVPRHAIDLSQVRKAAEQAQIAGFIEDTPKGYAGLVGERGIRLSGGQRQRIGIARALYKEAKVIILDEATSALDSDTEEAVMTAVERLSWDLTIVMIAHRVSTVRRCDRVIRITEGRIAANGLPQEVLPGTY